VTISKLSARQPARDAGEEARDDEGQVAHLLGVVADELDPLGVVAHRVEHAAQRRAGEGEHGRHRQEGVDGDEVVHLHRRAEVDAHEALAHHPVARDAALAAEELRDHERHGEHQLAQAQRDHGEGGARLARGDVAEQHREQQAGQPAGHRHQRHRDRHEPADTLFSAWMARNAPRPVYTACPKLSMPPCPSSML
jgi:hypothetical protein